MLEEEKFVRESFFAQYSFWWTSCFPQRRAGAAITTMWKNNPFGAVLKSDAWTWWSLERVMSEGVIQAKGPKTGGIVVAGCEQGVAMLTWPKGQRHDPVLMLVQFPQDGTGHYAEPKAVDIDHFLEAKGFLDPHQVIACAAGPNAHPVLDPERAKVMAKNRELEPA